MRLRFNDLPQIVRVRLLEIVNVGRDRDPRILAIDPFFTRQPGLRGFKKFTLVVGVVVAIACLNEVVGRAIHYAIGSEPLVYWALAAAIAVVLGSVFALVADKVWPPPPWRQGRWAFPGSVVHLERGWLEIFPTADLGKPTVITTIREGRARYATLALAPGLTFDFGSDDLAKQAAMDFVLARERISEAAGDLVKLQQVDPFAECAHAKRWAWEEKDGPQIAAVPARMSLLQWVVPAILGVVTSTAIYFWVQVTWLKG
jgi:hypothetical protein